MQTRILRKLRSAEQPSIQRISPPMQGTHDAWRSAAPPEHYRLAVPADIGNELDAALIAHEHLGIAHPLERLVIADVAHHELVTHVSGTALEKQALLELVDPWIEIPID